MNREIEVNNEEEDKENELFLFFFLKEYPDLGKKNYYFYQNEIFRCQNENLPSVFASKMTF